MFWDILYEVDRYNIVEVDGKKYDIITRFDSDMFEVNTEEGYYVGEIYAEDDEEAIEEIKELIDEE